VKDVDPLSRQPAGEAHHPARIQARALRLDPDRNPGSFRALGHPTGLERRDHRLVPNAPERLCETHDHPLGAARAARFDREHDPNPAHAEPGNR
jgi:hypothetical protein